MRVLVTGSRDWKDKGAIWAALMRCKLADENLTVIHGAARGADQIAGEQATYNVGVEKVEEYPADWEKYGKRAGPIRNQQMLDEGKPDVVLAFPLPNSRGTKHMISIAVKAGVPTYVYDIVKEGFTLVS